jgi:cytochrome bd-type quinol oxidase subunit 2
MSAFKSDPNRTITEFIGIVIMLVAGVLIRAHPYPSIYSDVSEDFVNWQNAVAIVMIIHSIILFVAYGLRKANEKESIAISVVFMAIYLMMTLRLFDNPDIVPVLSYSKDKLHLLEDSEFKDSAVKLALGGIMAIMGLIIANNVITFFKQLRKQQ